MRERDLPINQLRNQLTVSLGLQVVVNAILYIVLLLTVYILRHSELL